MGWGYLKSGDIVDLIATGYGIKPKEIAPCEDYIRSIGLTPRTPKNLLGEDLFSSNTQANRLSQLKNALYAEDSKAIWCIKGGYGTANLIPELDNLQPPNSQKLVIGFSDITALHLFLIQKWGWSSIHGSVVWQLMKNRVDSKSVKLLNDYIFGKSNEQKFQLQPLNNKVNQDITGQVTGGNLMLIQSSLATSWHIQTQGKIIFIEDIDENAYRVDRILNHLNQAGVFHQAKAVIFGDFICEEIENQSQNIAKLQQNFADKINIPVYKLAGIGHGETNNPLPLGTNARIATGENLLICSCK